MTKLLPDANLSGLLISAGIEAEPDGVIALDPGLAAIWNLAAPYLLVRDNDAHTLYAVGLARALLEPHSEADAAVVLPAILAEAGYDAGKVPAVLDIIDGHDSRREAISIEDAIVKDADKTWRLSPHGIDTVMDWFGLDRGQALRLCSQRVHGHLFTAESQSMARALSALESVTLWPQRQALLGGE